MTASRPDTIMLAPSRDGSTALAELMIEYRDRPFLLIEPNGNFGDMLIWAGMRRLADRLGINYRSINHAQVGSSDWSSQTVVYIHGGGGFVPFWGGTHGRSLSYVASRHSGVLVVGPNSYSADQNYLEEVLTQPLTDTKANRVVLFCREKPSYEAVMSAAGNLAEVHVDHDTAFNLTVSDLEAMAGEQVGQRRGYDLYAIRRDVESVDVGRGPLMGMPIDPVRYCYNLERWLRLHIRARQIVTNRLHSAIVGAILGRPTVLLPNSYHKARGVFDLSLESLGVEWRDHLGGGWLPSSFGVAFDHFLEEQPLIQRIAGRLRFGAGV